MRTLLRFAVHDSLPTAPKPLYLGYIQTSGPYLLSAFRPATPYYIFKYTFSGKATLTERGSAPKNILPGMAYLLKFPNSRFNVSSHCPEKEPWTGVYLEFEAGCLEPFLRQLIKRQGVLFEISVESPLLGKLMSYKEQGYADGDAISLSGFDGAKLVWELLGGLQTCGGNASRRRNDLLKSFCDYVNENIGRELATAQVAKALGLSRGHLNLLVSKGMKLPPHQYIARAKIRKACFLLDEGRHSNKEIAEAIGISSLVSFYRLFKELVGLTPREFRSSSRRIEILRGSGSVFDDQT